MNRVLVTDGRSRASLAIVRSLGKRGIEVTSGEAFGCSSFYSKYTAKKLVYPAPDKQPELFLKKIIETLKNDEYTMIMPVRDDANLILAKHKH